MLYEFEACMKYAILIKEKKKHILMPRDIKIMNMHMNAYVLPE